ncbi:MAG TPA: hypothetical protein VJ827_04765 [Rubrobacter sp.]|nr:hypothetical protein [Rubrobacter sp.]
MRKVVAAEFLSLDGVMESPDKWHFPYFNDEMGQAVGEGFGAADGMLWGGLTTRSGPPSGLGRIPSRTRWQPR